MSWCCKLASTPASSSSLSTSTLAIGLQGLAVTGSKQFDRCPPNDRRRWGGGPEKAHMYLYWRRSRGNRERRRLFCASGRAGESRDGSPLQELQSRAERDGEHPLRFIGRALLGEKTQLKPKTSLKPIKAQDNTISRKTGPAHVAQQSAAQEQVQQRFWLFACPFMFDFFLFFFFVDP